MSRRRPAPDDDLFDRIFMPTMPIWAMVLMGLNGSLCMFAWSILFRLPDDDSAYLTAATWVAVAVPVLTLLAMVFLTIVARIIDDDLTGAFDVVVARLPGSLFVLSPVGLVFGWLVAVPLGWAAMGLGVAESVAWRWIIFPVAGLACLWIASLPYLRFNGRSLIPPWTRAPGGTTGAPLAGDTGQDVGEGSSVGFDGDSGD
ncbi:hypothetical protein EDC02_4495 [Micromonospora sp. Llam0]|uniref:hypothetical protein n=1 Tax=Micromonospora sp. Llam0 TaxID=2485143 RepID=UPI000FB9228E|nr:hypothetical protein [Micromonospora sp. Llam0]ROO62514.1 hypothetical protein EDC02_4495 [Micromonospora sp. Llam0]